MIRAVLILLFIVSSAWAQTPSYDTPEQALRHCGPDEFLAQADKLKFRCAAPLSGSLSGGGSGYVTQVQKNDLRRDCPVNTEPVLRAADPTKWVCAFVMDTKRD